MGERSRYQKREIHHHQKATSVCSVLSWGESASVLWLVSSKEVNKFHLAYVSVLRANMD
ncbi:signal recognition particle domain protein, partial [Ostertagia ostertagi]